MILIGFMKQFIYLCSIRYAQMYMSTCTVYTYQSIELTAILATIHMLGSNTHTHTNNSEQCKTHSPNKHTICYDRKCL